MHIERWQRIGWEDQFVDEVELFEQRRELRLHAQHNSSAALCDLWHVAAELDRVAEALLGEEEDSFAVQIAAVPERRGQRFDGKPELPGVPAPFVMLKSFEEVPYGDQ